MLIVLGNFQLFIYVCNGFQSLFVDHTKAFIVLTNRKSWCWPGSLYREVKDVIAYLTIGLKGQMIPQFVVVSRMEFQFQ